MHEGWRTFLEHAGAELDGERVRHFGLGVQETSLVTSGTVLADLSHLGLISACGSDAASFLHGQLTNDLEGLSTDRSLLAAFLNPKGRMLADFRVYRHNGTFYLCTDRHLVPETLKRLRMFVLRANVTLEDASDGWVRIGYAGPDADRALADQGLSIPATVDGVAHADGLTLIRLPGPHPRFEIHGDKEPVEALWTRLDVQAAPVGADAWTLLDIRAGLPAVHPETVEEFVPQMVNYDLLGGLNFKKGCYPGQEVVARMRYLGKLKRRTYRAAVRTGNTPPPGTPVYKPDDAQSVGTVISACPTSEVNQELLAMIQIEAADEGNVRLGDPEGAALELLDLPYSLDPQ